MVQPMPQPTSNERSVPLPIQPDESLQQPPLHHRDHKGQVLASPTEGEENLELKCMKRKMDQSSMYFLNF